MTQAATTRFKTFMYDTAILWANGRQGTLSAEGKPSLAVASPPEFKGIPGVWTPEDLLVASIESCQMTTFLALAARAGLQLRRYRSSARGILENPGDGYRFTSVEVQPHIVAAHGTEVGTVEELVRQAHSLCLVSRSVTCSVIVRPEITTEEE